MRRILGAGPFGLQGAAFKLNLMPAASEIGNALSVSSALFPDHFISCEFEAETSVYYYRARYYDPTAGRFLTEDPLSSHAGSSYTYVDNWPTHLTDPFGLFPVPECVKKILSPYFPRLNWNLVDLHNIVPLGPGTHGFTWDNNVFIAPGDWNPHTTLGISLIAHELTHVQQFQDLGETTFAGWYAFDLFMNYYFDRNWDRAYQGVHYEKQAFAMEDKVTDELLRKFKFEDPCPEKKPCGSK